MKKYLLIVLITLFIVNCKSNSNNNPPRLDCNGYWGQVSFNDFCTMDLSQFDLEGLNDICNARSNDTYANDELIYIYVYNNFDEAGAIEEYMKEKEAFESAPEFTELNDLGDEAFSVLKVEFNRLDRLTVVARKGIYTISLEINGNAANNSNNCFTPTSVFDFVKALVTPL